MRSRRNLILAAATAPIAAVAVVLVVRVAGRGTTPGEIARDARATTTTSRATSPVPSQPGRDTSSGTDDPLDLATVVCAAPRGPVVSGRVENSDLSEASGLVVSPNRPDVLWAHNDSGHDPVLFAMASDGADLGEFRVTGAENRDWEDIAARRDPTSGLSYLYLADTGDFHPPATIGGPTSERDHVTVYRVEEPDVQAGRRSTSTERSTSDAIAYELTYPDGPRDAEALMVDPATGDLYLITKGWGTDKSEVFRATDPQAGSRTELERVATIHTGSVLALVTGADANGVIVVRTYLGVLVFALSADGIEASLQRTPCEGASTAETQGEAIAIAADRSGYYTLSEGLHPVINWFAFEA